MIWMTLKLKLIWRSYSKTYIMFDLDRWQEKITWKNSHRMGKQKIAGCHWSRILLIIEGRSQGFQISPTKENLGCDNCISHSQKSCVYESAPTGSKLWFRYHISWIGDGSNVYESAERSHNFDVMIAITHCKGKVVHNWPSVIRFAIAISKSHIEHTMCRDLHICQFQRFVIFDMVYWHCWTIDLCS